MSDSTPRAARITTIVVGAAVAALLALTAATSLRGGAADATGATATPTAPGVVTPAPTPQPTTTAAIDSPAPIRADITAEVTDMAAVKGLASQPGEIGGPAVRFTVTLTNTTDHVIDLSNTVVNAYSGTDEEPAYPLSRPGGTAFPAAVAAGERVTGAFVFTIAVADRNHVTVAVDTSTANPVVAFVGVAPH